MTADFLACLFGAFVRFLLVLPVSLSAPLVVPLALLFTRRDANALPLLFRWWDNDISINGDQSEGDETYYALGHERRSVWARYVWLGLRNRGSWLAQRLGHRWSEWEIDDRQTWGDRQTSRKHEGWQINRAGSVWQVYAVKRIGRFCLRINCGYKVWPEWDRKPVAAVVFIPASILTWQGEG